MLSLVNGDYQARVIPNAPLRRACDDEALLRLNGGFTLFFLVDSTNRQSLSALPIVSQWCHHALNHGGNDTCVCIPNHPVTANENDLCHLSSDSNLPTAKEQVSHMMSNTGFYHLHFSHPKRIFLLKILCVTRVPCVVVVSNADGRIVTRYGWEAIEREMDDERVRAKIDDGSAPPFESRVIKEWKNGKSGLPLWWHLLGWLLF